MMIKAIICSLPKNVQDILLIFISLFLFVSVDDTWLYFGFIDLESI